MIRDGAKRGSLRGSRESDDRTLAGMLARVAVAFSALLLLSCAHAHIEIFESGEKICEVEAWVLGTGETELVSTACGDFGYSTRDTGISDNGRDLAGALAEGAASGLVPGSPWNGSIDWAPNQTLECNGAGYCWGTQ